MPNSNQPANSNQTQTNSGGNNHYSPSGLNFMHQSTNLSQAQSNQQQTQPQPGQTTQPNQPGQTQPHQTQPKRPSQPNQSESDQARQNQANQAQQQRTDNSNNYYPNIQPEQSRVAPGMYKPLPEEKILVWQAPSRPFKKRNKKYFSTVAIIALLISLILGFAGQLVAITVVISVAFLAYVLSVIPPQDITYQITTYGIRVENNLYYWEELGRYWFTDKYNQKILNIETLRFPGRINLLLGDQDQKLIDRILSEVLLNQKPEPTLYEKASLWLQEKIPLDLEE
jgi:hypothetical protein